MKKFRNVNQIRKQSGTKAQTRPVLLVLLARDNRLGFTKFADYFIIRNFTAILQGVCSWNQHSPARRPRCHLCTVLPVAAGYHVQGEINARGESAARSPWAQKNSRIFEFSVPGRRLRSVPFRAFIVVDKSSNWSLNQAACVACDHYC
jgi:hypothetical protein